MKGTNQQGWLVATVGLGIMLALTAVTELDPAMAGDQRSLVLLSVNTVAVILALIGYLTDAGFNLE
jgi:hypothetical protein